MMQTYDLIVLGGGSAGYAAARTAADFGKRVAVVDGARELGGLCILRGCMPSKTLLHAADVLHQARKAKAFGVRAEDVAIDMKALHRWKKTVIAEFADYRRSELQSHRYDLYRSYARFENAHVIVMQDGVRIRGRKILIATGSRIRVPDLPGLKDVPYWTSDDVLDLDSVPDSVIVLGGGPVACELAQFLCRIGTKVIILQRNARLLKHASPEASAVVRQAFEEEGIRVCTEMKLESVSVSARGVVVKFLQEGKSHRLRASHLFHALGREPNIEKLDVKSAGIAAGKKGGIEVNRWQQTNVPHIYAAGDVCGPHEIVHLAIAQGELAAKHAFHRKSAKPIRDDLLLSVVFTDPPVASLGLQERVLRKRKIPYLSASHSFGDHGKSIVMKSTRGYVRIFAEPEKGRLLGAEIAGIQADSLIHCLSGPLAMKATVHDLLRAPWYHPTLAEILTYPLEALAQRIVRR